MLAIQAHPDDESFGLGGTLALYASRGVEVTLVTATQGEMGIVPSGFLKEGQTVADLRSDELTCAVNTLGISRHIQLGFRDSGLLGWDSNKNPLAFINQAESSVAARLLDIIRAIEPQVVLIHNEKGDYGHPDHLHAHKCSLTAFQSYLKEFSSSEFFHKPRLFAHLMPNELLKAGVFFYRLQGKDPHKFGERGDIDLVKLLNEQLPVHARINYKTVKNVKQKASACHASQGGGKIVEGMESFIQKLVEKPVDSFMQLYPAPKAGQPLLTDLF